MASLHDLMEIADEERALFLANEERYTVAMVRADTAEAELRALREALEEIRREAQDVGELFENRIARIEATAADALAPEPPEDAPAPAGGA